MVSLKVARISMSALSTVVVTERGSTLGGVADRPRFGGGYDAGWQAMGVRGKGVIVE